MGRSFVRRTAGVCPSATGRPATTRGAASMVGSTSSAERPFDIGHGWVDGNRGSRPPLGACTLGRTLLSRRPGASGPTGGVSPLRVASAMSAASATLAWAAEARLACATRASASAAGEEDATATTPAAGSGCPFDEAPVGWAGGATAVLASSAVLASPPSDDETSPSPVGADAAEKTPQRRNSRGHELRAGHN